jgi:hypothetical protein
MSRSWPQLAAMTVGGTMMKHVHVVALGAAVLTTACGHEDSAVNSPPGSVTCHLAASTPAFDASGVAPAQQIELTWSEPVDAGTVANQVELKNLGGEAWPFTLQQTGPTSFALLPQKSLWLWDEYAVLVGDGVQTSGGDACTGQEIAFSTLQPTALDRDLRPAGAAGIGLVGHYALTASNSYRGLQVYDASKPDDVKLISEVATAQSPTGLTIDGDRAYVPAGVEGVLVFDVGALPGVTLIGHVGTPGTALHVVPFEQAGRRYIAIADLDEAVRVVDVTEPAGPVDVGVIDPSGNHTARSRGVDVRDGLMAIADGTGSGAGSLALIDIADVENPVLLSKTPDDYDLYDVRLAPGGLAYASRGALGVRSWNIANPLAPVVTGTLESPSTEPVDVIQRLALDGDELFASTVILGVERIALDGTGTMAMAAIHDLPGQSGSLAVNQDHIFAGSESGLVVYPRGAQSGATPSWIDPNGHGTARSVAIVDGQAYVAAGSRGLQTFAIAADKALSIEDRDDTAGLGLDIAAFSVALAGNLAVVGDARGGVSVFDRSDAANPILISSLTSDDSVAGTRVVGDTLYACQTNKGLIVASLADPAAPTLLSKTQVPPDLVACLDIEVIGDIGLIGANAGLGVVDLADPTAPQWLGWAPLPRQGTIHHVQRVGDRLLAGFRSQDFEGTYDISYSLLVVDVSDPAQPSLVWESDNLGGAADIVVAGDIAFLAGGREGVFVFDISDIDEPRLQGAIPTAGNANGLALDDTTLYVAQGNGGLIAIPLGQLPPH